VRAVPTFLIDNRHVLEGAQPPDLWLRVIDEIAAQVAPEPPEPD
jgi:predicted DsbA family dithiol-disulfide isomerase